MPGRVEPREIQHLLQTAAIFVSASTWPEPLSRAVLEAMAHGTAIVATAVGGTAEAVVHERSGLLVRPGDAPQLADAICRLLDNPGLRASLAAGAKTLLKARFSQEAVLPAMLATYRRVSQRA
jgi:glycosyltransferase involved in cell wall biosynthesis